MNLKIIIEFLKAEGIKYQLLHADYDIEVRPASLKNTINNGLYYSVGKNIVINENLEDSIFLCDRPLKNENVQIVLENPQIVHYQLSQEFSLKPEFTVHKTAIIHKEAVISKDVKIGPYAVIGKCVIEEKVEIGSHTVIYDNVKIKKGSFIDSHSCIGAAGIAWVWDQNGNRVLQPQMGGVIVGQSCHLGTDVTIVRGSTSENTLIGDGTVMAHGSKIGHGVVIEALVHMANNVSIAGNATIGERSFLGSACIVSSNITVPKNTIIGAGAMVNKNFEEEFITLAGVPAKVIKRKNFENKPKGAPSPFKTKNDE